MPGTSGSVNVPRAIEADPEKTMITESKTTLRLLWIRSLSIRALALIPRILVALCAVVAAASLGVHLTVRRQRAMAG